MATAIEFNNISKLYRLGLVSTGTLAHDFKRWWVMNVRRQEDPYLTIGETNDRSTKGSSEYVWALRDIDFKVEQGDVVGIIGKNGAGKSTLLKILSKVTAPTTGSIRARGRIGSLLEVGTGFHPEMTGRENIYLNGTILGMTKQEISRKLDEIIDFSGCERYIDTPVKRYSSGMMVRLGFAVAAHLDPEILVVDEVLAVGDAEFQKKAIGKMQDVSKGEGRTVLFVSHNMAAVKSLCNRGVVLENGKMVVDSNIDDALVYYMQSTNNEETQNIQIIDHIQSKEPYISISEIKINGTSQVKSLIIPNQREMDVEIFGETTLPFTGNIKLIFKTMDGQPLAALAESTYKAQLIHFGLGPFSVRKRITLPQYLNAGDCKIDLLLYNKNTHFFAAKDCASVHMMGNFDGTGMPLNVHREGFCGLDAIDL